MGRYSVIDNNILDKQGILNLLKNFIFGNSPVEIYDQNKTYNINDKAFIIDTTTGDIKVVTAIDNGVTGPYDPTKWDDMTLVDAIGTGLDDVVVISETEPDNKIVQIWLTPNEYSEHYITVPDPPPTPPDIPGENESSVVNLLFTNKAVPIVDDADTADLNYLDAGDIVFDWEGDGDVVISGLTSVDSKEVITIDEQEDILVDDDPPTNTDHAILWVDTDLSDDNI